MRYWVYEKSTKKVLGPYPPKRIAAMPGFSEEWKVAPAGATTRDAWAAVKDLPDFQPLLGPGPAEPPPPPAGAPPSPYPAKKPA